MNKDTLVKTELLNALRVKAKERDSVSAIQNYKKHLLDIAKNPEIAKIWTRYSKNYPYAKDIALSDILAMLSWALTP